MDMRSPMSLLPLRLDHVTFTAGGRRIIDDLSLAIDAGPRTVIVGPNGAGKSVLLRLCHGLLAPSSGSIAWNSAEPAGAPRRQAMVFQRPVLLRRSALANVAHALGIAGVPARIRSQRAREALSKVGLERHAAHPARVLSGGEQQRLALARAWALQPDVLLLDEPTASLDPSAKREVEQLLAEFAEQGTTLLMASHNFGQVKRLAQRVVYLEHGRILADAPLAEFFGGAVAPEARLFLKGELPW